MRGRRGGRDKRKILTKVEMTDNARQMRDVHQSKDERSRDN